MENKYKYYAFISYNHLDEKWAKKLQYRLHHYRLPTVARKEIGEDVKIRPVFRYVTNLAIGPLKKGIGKELEESKYLIVICSPNSAQPNIKGEHWVNDEVKRFMEMGRGDRIVPVIVGGEPNAGDEHECFPPALRKSGNADADEISAANLVQGSRRERRDAFLKIVAKLLDLQPDQLIKLTDREDRQRKIRTWLRFVPLLALLLMGGLFAWDANRTARNYYANYVDSFGLPEGIFPLRESDLAHRHIHYRFEYNGFQHGKSPHADSADWCIWSIFGFRRRLVRVVQSNSHGYPCRWENTEYSDRPQIQDFKYDSDLRLCEVRYGRYHGEGKDPCLEKRIEFWNENEVVNGLIKMFASEGQLDKAFTASSLTTLTGSGAVGTKSGITQNIVRRDAGGRVVQRLFLNRSDTNIPDGDGIYGFSYEYDDYGRQTAQWYLFRDGDGFSRRANKKGVSGKKYEYSKRNLRKVEYVDVDGRPIMGPHGWIICEKDFNEFDNCTVLWFFDEKGRRAFCINGYAGMFLEYDCGDITRQSYFDIGGKLTLHKDGFAEVRLEYDGRGNNTKMLYFGIDGKPTLSKDGFSKACWEYDDYGNKTKASYFDIDGNLTLIVGGYAVWTAEYDDRGNMTTASFFGIDGKPFLQTDGVAKVCWEYNDCGNNTKESYFDEDGKPTPCNNGYAEVRLGYDRGNITKISYYDRDGKLTRHREGNAGYAMEYDERGCLLEQSFWGEDEKPALHERGVAKVRWEYDSYGNKTKETYFGLDGNRTLSNEGYAEMHSAYDQFGNPKEQTFYGLKKERVTCTAGVHRVVFTYDKNGNCEERRFWGVDNKPILNIEGVAGWKDVFDPYGNVLSRVAIGLDGHPIASAENNAGWRCEYDRFGNRVMVVNIGVDGLPVQMKKGYVIERREYDDFGRVILNSFQDAEGKPTNTINGFATIKRSYDVYGKQIDCEYFSCNGDALLPVVFVAEVMPDSLSAQFGVACGDVWCCLGMYNFLLNENVFNCANIAKQLKDAKKKLIVARKTEDEYEIHSFNFPVGLMGIEFRVNCITDFDKLEQAYKAYCEKEKGENK